MGFQVLEIRKRMLGLEHASTLAANSFRRCHCEFTRHHRHLRHESHAQCHGAVSQW